MRFCIQKEDKGKEYACVRMEHVEVSDNFEFLLEVKIKIRI